MAKTVILSERRGLFKRWADQFVNADPENRGIVIVGNIQQRASHTQKLRFINNYYARAARLAGNDGRLIISLGHGGSSETNSTIGMVDLLPNRALRLQNRQIVYSGSETEEGDINVLSRAPNARVCRRLFNSFDLEENTRTPQPPENDRQSYFDCLGVRGARPRQNFQQAYAQIGTLLSQAELTDVVFLTCRVGNATDFIDRMSRNWQISIVAYEKRVAVNRDNEANPYYLYLVDEENRKYRNRIPTRYTYRSRI